MTLHSSDDDWIKGVAGDGVVTIGDPRLKAPTATIAPAEAGGLLETLAARLRDLNGAGLAAPQIGVSVKAAVIEVRKTDLFPDRPETGLIQVLNPVIVERSDETALDWEGCFSVPGYLGLVPGPKASPSGTSTRQERPSPGSSRGTSPASSSTRSTTSTASCTSTACPT